ncbi:MAG: hypothetical protein KDK65_03040 [Chlamydiia bacterium]|nr:hypothetical protein [Chlamydiia bacterium]
MHRNRAWLSFLFVIAFVVMGYSLYVSTHYRIYASHSASVPIEEIQWNLFTLPSGETKLRADYTFTAETKNWKGTTLIGDYINPSAAQAALPLVKEDAKVVWYDPQSPYLNTIDRVFPTKQVIYAIVLWGILLYFIGLGYYVGAKS